MAELPANLAARWRTLTQARIGLGRTGQSLTVKASLDFELAHARARDAVHALLDVRALRSALGGLECIEVRSRAGDRATYLQRPDLGRLPCESARHVLAPGDAELVIVIGDGLSAAAVARHAAPLVHAVIEHLSGWSVAPIVLAHQARVALGDEVGCTLGANLVLMLIGERPGLTAPDSLGAYMTWAPQRGRRDSERNCVSNIRPPYGLSYVEAASQICRILDAARTTRATGLGLNDERIADFRLEPKGSHKLDG